MTDESGSSSHIPGDGSPTPNPVDPSSSSVGVPQPQYAVGIPAGWYPDPSDPTWQRFWDGQMWTEKLQHTGASNVAPAAVVNTEPISDVERRALLARQIQFAVSSGARVETQSDFQAVLVRGKPVNHVLHAILTVFTCIWGIVWAVIAGTGGETRELIVIDDFGNVQIQNLGKR